jgi:hypothetical protein
MNTHRSVVVALLLLSGICIGASGCGEMAIPPAGSYSEVLLVTEDGPGSEWTSLLKPLIAHEIDYYIDVEDAFRVTAVEASKMGQFPAYKNIVICGVLDSSTDVGQIIMRLIGQEGIQRIGNEGATILKKEDEPVRNQLTLILTADDAGSLRAAIKDWGDELNVLLEESCQKRLRRHLLTRENEALAADLYKRYGFRLEVPPLYRLIKDKTTPPGVELIREPPTRLLGVFWTDRETAPTLADKDELFQLRADYVWKRYDEDQMDKDRVRFEPVRLGPYDAIRMSGYWYNDESVMGGYYETYYIFDEPAKLLWAVDLLVLAPGKPKHPLVRELRALAETFRYD